MALDKKLQAKLNKAKGLWAGAKEKASQSTGFAEFEDGRYLARLVSAEIGEAKSSGRLQVVWQWKFAEEPYKGQSKFAYDGLETADNLMYVARAISKFGYEVPDDLGELEALLNAIVNEKPLCRIRLKTNGDFQNVYIDTTIDPADEQSALDDSAAESATEEEAAVEEAVEEEGATEEAVEEETTEEETTEEEADVVLEVGMRVLVPYQNAMVGGAVIEILENESKVRAKLDNGKTVKCPIDKLESEPNDAEVSGEVEEDLEEEVPAAPPAKVAPPAAAKKPVAAAPAPAAKPAPVAAKPAPKPAPAPAPVAGPKKVVKK